MEFQESCFLYINFIDKYNTVFDVPDKGEIYELLTICFSYNLTYYEKIVSLVIFLKLFKSNMFNYELSLTIIERLNEKTRNLFYKYVHKKNGDFLEFSYPTNLPFWLLITGKLLLIYNYVEDFKQLYNQFINETKMININSFVYEFKHKLPIFIQNNFDILKERSKETKYLEIFSSQIFDDNDISMINDYFIYPSTIRFWDNDDNLEVYNFNIIALKASFGVDGIDFPRAHYMLMREFIHSGHFNKSMNKFKNNDIERTLRGLIDMIKSITIEN